MDRLALTFWEQQIPGDRNTTLATDNGHFY